MGLNWLWGIDVGVILLHTNRCPTLCTYVRMYPAGSGKVDSFLFTLLLFPVFSSVSIRFFCVNLSRRDPLGVLFPLPACTKLLPGVLCELFTCFI